MKSYRGKIFFLCFFLITLCLFLFLNIVIGPLIISFVAAYLINPLFEFLENKGIKRSFISFATLIILTVLSILAIWIFFPILFEQLQGLIKLL
ncbi:MAG: AI-2E family transporter, partial [Silvanigrellaceae bacterium]|nr:AI-2E family transporter [Silvanigrellaceae bacterium]